MSGTQGFREWHKTAKKKKKGKTDIKRNKSAVTAGANTFNNCVQTDQSGRKMRTIPEGAFVSNPTNVPYMLAGIMWRLETNIVITLWQCILSLWAWGSQKYQGTFAFATPDTWQGLVCSWVLTAWLTGNAHLNTHTHTHIPACTSVWVFMHFNRIFKISILFETSCNAGEVIFSVEFTDKCLTSITCSEASRV